MTEMQAQTSKLKPESIDLENRHSEPDPLPLCFDAIQAASIHLQASQTSQTIQ
jgi:hypothetical protein